jgi:hypothetical protein
MSTRSNLDQLIAAANRLPAEDRQRLIDALKDPAPARQRHITELRGLGKEVWQGLEAQEYVNSERDSWAS